MAAIDYNSALKDQAYSRLVTMQAERRRFVFAFSGEGEDQAFQYAPRPSAKDGDTIQLRYAKRGDADNVYTDSTPTVGNEDRTEYLKDTVSLRYFKKHGKVENATKEQQLVSFPLKQPEITRLSGEWGELFEAWVWRQLSGATYHNTADDYKLTGGNIVTAMDSGHHIFADNLADDQAVAADSTAIFTYDLIEEVESRCGSKDYVEWPMVPCKTPVGHYYVCVVDHQGYKQLRSSTSSTRFMDVNLSMLQGGQNPMLNPLIHAGGTIYNGTLILRSDFIAKGVSADGLSEQDNCKRAVFFGAGAGDWLWGKDHAGEDQHINYTEHWIHDRCSIQTTTLAGFKRRTPTPLSGAGASPSAESYGAFAISYYVP